MALEMVEHPERKDEILAMGVNGFDKYLVTAGFPDPDLIIRTSGENRISNYLLWQSAYTEFLFVDTLWPDFRENDFNAALEAYAKRDRRYGKVK
jgi:undecaprenyl diphosphate synthase